MMVRDRIIPLFTQDSMQTVKEMVNLMKSIGTLDTVRNTAPPLQITGGNPDILMEKINKPDIDFVRCIWACIRGIAAASADMYIGKFCPADIICRRIPRHIIVNLKTPNGRAVNKKTIQNIIKVYEGKDITTEQKMLACIPRISIGAAKELITAQRRLKDLLSYEVGAISIIKTGKNQRNLGAKLANDIIKMMNFKLDSAGAGEVTENLLIIDPAVTNNLIIIDPAITDNLFIIDPADDILLDPGDVKRAPVPNIEPDEVPHEALKFLKTI